LKTATKFSALAVLVPLAAIGLSFKEFASEAAQPRVPPGGPSSATPSFVTSTDGTNRSYPSQVPHAPDAAVRHRGLPTSLDDVPKTPEFLDGVAWLRWSGSVPPLNTEGYLDFHLRFRNRLETCFGPFPDSGKITYELLFQPNIDPDGEITEMGSPSLITVRDAIGLSDGDAARLAECGKVAYGLPLVLLTRPEIPDYHFFLTVSFPVTDDSFPYKLLRTGVNK
jgi:hypothetical protein